MREYSKLDPVFKKDWIEALRGGKYKQTHCMLKFKNEYCCIGVARKILNDLPSKNDPEIESSQPGEKAKSKGLYPRTSELLANYNDGATVSTDHVWSFEEIADWIEANL